MHDTQHPDRHTEELDVTMKDVGFNSFSTYHTEEYNMHPVNITGSILCRVAEPSAAAFLK